MLSNLVFMNLYVGEDDITGDKDWKHVFKRLRNLLIRPRGIVVGGVRLTPDILKQHLRSSGLSSGHIHSTFNPEDLQDVKLAFDMLKDIWSLPREAPSDARPGFQQARNAIWVLGQFLHHLVYPYLCVDLSLSEQLEHLSAAAHLALALYHTAGKEFLPTLLYVDIMIAIKNVFFCVAKAKIDTPDGKFWIILLGTDRLEKSFGILRTMVPNDSNLDVLQLCGRLGGTVDVANILALFPEWDRAPRRLRLPALSRDSKEIPDSADHLEPRNWRGNLFVKFVVLQTVWRRGRSLAEDDVLPVASILKTLEKQGKVDILAPKGVLLFDIPLPSDDIDESLEAVASNSRSKAEDGEEQEMDSEVRVEVEDALVDYAGSQQPSPTSGLSMPSIRGFERTIQLDGKDVSKARVLSMYSKYRKVASSTDRLKRVQEVARFATDHTLQETASNLLDSRAVLLVHDPIATLVSCDGRFWLCLGEVNGLKLNGQSTPHLSHTVLREDTVTVSFQLLGLRPAKEADNSQSNSEDYSDWRTYNTPERSFDIPGRFIEVVNPEMIVASGYPSYYLFQSPVLIAVAAALFQRLAASDLKLLPKTAPTNEYPYREGTGKFGFN
ncbi:hypothetical protein EST38_g12377 [Candolleomyces aberdarensis]|uniref:Uncharacterized protein n=1 Tax=Candolleomyces aberdarensis TaxID=2316362 RepID=A0A4V1Q212_9AGAR|nr:hypothetical protein EST38_g12377 [Candolleomyces aberdarensis]